MPWQIKNPEHKKPGHQNPGPQKPHDYEKYLQQEKHKQLTPRAAGADDISRRIPIKGRAGGNLLNRF
jgi:hypothetical protein